MIKLVGMLMFFVAVFLLVLNLFPKKEEEDVKKMLEDEIVVGESARFVNIFRPFFQIFLPFIEKLPVTDYREKIANFAVSAGIEEEVSPDEFMGFQISTGVLFAFMGLALFKSFPLTMIFGIVGIGYPYIWLYEKKNKRQADILSGMPDVVDMLSLSVEAGLDFNSGVMKVCDIHKEEKNAFVEELYLMHKNMKLGKSREDALKTMADRVDMQDMDSFVSILIQAEKMGVSISSVLKSQAVRMRQERFMKAERVGAIASQKLLVPMMLLIFPVIFIIVFGPFILKFIYNG